MNNEGLFLVLSGPSGAGKTSLVEWALGGFSEFQKPVSYTTRPPRSDETHGKSYYFVSRREFQKLQKEKAFVEWAEVYGEFYGTAFKEVWGIWNRGKFLIKDLDIQGMQSVKRAFSRVVTVFVVPPSLDMLKERLVKRGQEPFSLPDRLSRAEGEAAYKEHCDYSIVNGNFETACGQLKKIIEKAKDL